MTIETYMQDLLRQLSSGLLVPVMVVLALLAAYAVWCIGSILVEVFMERRHFKANVPEFIDAIEAAEAEEIPGIIENSGMLKTQKKALQIVASRMHLNSTDLFALARREMDILTERYELITTRSDMAAKIAPMFGLMGTLIPLGPGIVAMGQGKTAELASSLLVAFDTTVAGLIVAVLCLVIGKIRKTWYARYMSASDAAMTAILQKASQLNGAADEIMVLQAALENVLNANVSKYAFAAKKDSTTSTAMSSTLGTSSVNLIADAKGCAHD